MDTPQDAPRRSPLKLIVAIVVPLLVIGVGVYLYASSASTAKVGDCLRDGATADAPMAKVACGETADYRVVGRLEGKKKDEIGETRPCERFPTTAVTYWEGDESSGNLLCLEPYHP
ncbi:hypothetical protein NLX83_01980 [Allokutzneria sp. A3M-2-11 16]|uniref:LppU/SCO3897 family protein n=1 Tax=Allokutzneria sp. A3M-2-11 16 TaxID=2962043 RepID=UPI0020B89295|nr:hypothetical protein [Allokutzneria sp. A3M-2-11 16]MCP3798018.1 hypothetical protein [Allokutzneria sp. A3M-2-11 16]